MLTEILPLPLNKRVQHVCHLSDLHIRQGEMDVARFDEYHLVFKRILSFLSTFKYIDSTVVVITGDLFHNKLTIGPSGSMLFTEFLKNLSALAPVYIIRGNHDYRQDKPNEPDMISPYLAFKSSNIAYLDKPGYYIADDVGFAVMPIQYTLESGNTCGKVAVLPMFPPSSGFPDSVKTKIALFHGYITPDLHNKDNSISINWFGKGFDYILLGDIHKQSIFDAHPLHKQIMMEKVHDDIFLVASYVKDETKTMWGYPSSTVQQGFGEHLLGHGFIMWNLDNYTADMMHVTNDTGMVRLAKQDGIWCVNVSHPSHSEFIPVNKIARMPWFPKTIYSQVVGHYDCTVNHDVSQALSALGITVKNASAAMADLDTAMGTSDDTIIDLQEKDLTSIDTPDLWIQFISDGLDGIAFHGWKEWFTNPDSIYLPKLEIPKVALDLQATIDDRNKKIKFELDKFYTDSQTHTSIKNNSMKIKYMSWSYVLCYKDDCYIDFEKLDKNIVCIGGKNGSGKTSFLEIICIALFGTSFPSRHNKAYSSSIICQQKPKNGSSFTSIVIEVDGKTFRVNRSFATQDNPNKINTRGCVVDALGEDGETWVNVQKDKSAVDEWVNRKVGDLNAFLLSCMITQHFDNDFFALKPIEQKERIDSALSLKSSTAFKTVLHTALLAYTEINNKLDHIYSCLTNQDGYRFDQKILLDATKELDACSQSLTDKTKVVVECEAAIAECNCDTRILAIGEAKLGGELDNMKATLRGLDCDTYTVEQALELRAKACAELEGLGGNVGGNRKALEDNLVALEASKPETIEESRDALNATQSGLFDSLNKLGSPSDLTTTLTKLKSTLEKYNVDLHLKTKKRDETKCGLEEATKHYQCTLENYKILTTTLPEQPRSTNDEYNAWNADVSSFIKKYASLESLKGTIVASLQPSCERPDMSTNELKNALSKLNGWIKKNKVDPFSPEFSKEYQGLVDTESKVSQKLSDAKKQVLDASTLLEVLEVENATLAKQLHDVLDSKPSEPAFLGKAKEVKVEKKKMADCQKRVNSVKDRFTSYNPTLDRTISEHGLEVINRLGHQKEMLFKYKDLRGECEEHPFNPDCEACRQQPWRKKVEQLDDEICKLEKCVKQIKKEMNSKFGAVIDMTAYNIAKNMTTDNALYEKDVEQLKMLEKYWSDYALTENNYDKWCTRKVDAQKAVNDKVGQLKKTQTSLKKCKCELDKVTATHGEISGRLEIFRQIIESRDGEYREIKAQIERNTKAIELWSAWQAKHDALVRDSEAWTVLEDKRSVFEEDAQRRLDCQRYAKAKESHENALTLAQNQQEVLARSAKDLEPECLELEKHVYEHERLVKDVTFRLDDAIRINAQLRTVDGKLYALDKYNDWQHQVDDLCKQIEALKLGDEITKLTTAYDLIKRCDTYHVHLRYVPWYVRLIQARTGVEDLHEAKIKLIVKTADLQSKYDESIKLQRQVEVMEKYIKYVKNIKSTLEVIEKRFGEFKSWVFQTKAMPILCSNVNHLLHVMCKHHRPIFLDVKFADDGTFTWFVKDGSSSPPFEKASGFQRFMTSLAMRITLGKLGVSGMSNRQLFIDEGFTACDSENLANVPDFLHGLLVSCYDMVMIVSHLDELKVIGSTLSIKRENGLSQLQEGHRNLPYFFTKKGGRKRML